MAFLALACAGANPRWIVMVNNNTDYPISIDLSIQGVAHHWVVPRYEDEWQLIQLAGPVNGAEIAVYQPETCTVAHQAELPAVSPVVNVDPGLPTVQEPFSKDVKVHIDAHSSLAADEKTLPESDGCQSPSST